MFAASCDHDHSFCCIDLPVFAGLHLYLTVEKMTGELREPMPDTEPNEKNNLEVERLRLEYERLRLDRQKLAVETRLKRRELLQSQNKIFKDLLANPLSLAIVGGFITLMTSIVTTSYSAKENREADERRAQQAVEAAKEPRLSDDRRAKQALEAELVKKFVEGPKEAVRANLKFLVDTYLLPDYAEGITAYLKNNPDAAPSVGATPAAPLELFKRQAPLLMRALISDFGFADYQAAAIVGNIGWETAGFRQLEELHPVGGRGGLGYLQWTGQKRNEFEAYAQSKGLELASTQANYGFLLRELQGAQSSGASAVRTATSLEEATRAFQDKVIRAAFPNYDQRVRYAQLALKAFQDSTSADSP